MTDLKDKIESIIQGLGLTPMKFADIIDIKRPIISHILTGRNNPSLEVVMKIVDRFPELGYDWISDHNDLDYKIIRKIRDTNQLDQPQTIIEPGQNGLNSIFDQASDTNKNIEKIIFFYSDGSFRIFQQ